GADRGGAGGGRPHGGGRHRVHRDLLSGLPPGAQRAGGPPVRGRAAVKRAAGREPVITIDGPAGAGKSTVARDLARRLGFALLSTGALYRALAWAVKEAGVRPDDGPALRAVLERTTVDLAGARVRVDARDV